MNLTLFRSTLKREALVCYNNALHSFFNHPFLDENPNIQRDIIEFEVNQGLGKKAIGRVINGGLSELQYSIMQESIKHYSNRIKNKFNEVSFDNRI